MRPILPKLALIPNPDNDTTRKEIQTNIISYKCSYKYLQENTNKPSLATYKKIIPLDQMGFILGM